MYTKHVTSMIIYLFHHSPGRYDSHAESGMGTCTPKKMEFHESFGGKKNLKDLVKIKCTNGIPETVSDG